MDRQANRTPALFPLIAFECQVGNTHSADYQAHTATTASGAAARDQFAVREWGSERKQAFASDFVATLVAGAGSRPVVGDVSWVHCQYGRELLLADSRVHCVFQYRENKEAWYTSLKKQKPKPGLPETILLRGLGISAKVRSVGVVLLLLGFYICTRFAARVSGPRWNMGRRVGSRTRNWKPDHLEPEPAVSVVKTKTARTGNRGKLEPSPVPAMGRPWAAHGPPMRRPWVAHGLPMGGP